MTLYLAVCTRISGNELVTAECESLTGGRPAADGVARCQTIAHVSRAAYVQTGLRLIAEEHTLPSLIEAVASQEFDATDFCIAELRLSRANPVRWREAVVGIANAIQAFPNLDFPKHRFLLVIRQDSLCFGEVLAEADHSYQQHSSKPYHLSSSLPARLARGLVNLVTPPAGSILDPCCGTGSVILEACALGLQAEGSDWNPRMVGMARKNLAHFGYPARVTRTDARQGTRPADAVVTDLPYGHFSPLDEGNVRAILQNCARLAPLGVFVAGADISAWLRQAGYIKVEVFRVQKRDTFSRYVHRAHV